MNTITYAHKNNLGYKILEVDSNEYTIKRDFVKTLPQGAIMHDKYIEIEHLEIDYIKMGYTYSPLDTCQDAQYKSKAEYIEITQWNDTSGNTYHSGIVRLENGNDIKVPYTYGYGRQWVDTLIEMEVIKRPEDLENVNCKVGYVKRKKDMI